MQRLIKTLVVLMSGLIFVTAVWADGLPNPIRFATEATYPPFESMGQNGQISGFDIDIAKALCAQMQVQCTFANEPFDSLIPSLNMGKFDALIAAMGITDERKQQVDFSDPYYQPTASFVAAKTTHLQLDAAAMKDKTVGVQQGTTFIDYLKNQYGASIKMKMYSSAQDALLDLQSGRVDTVIGDTPLILAWFKQNTDGQFEIVGEPIVDPKTEGMGYGIAIRKHEAALLQALNKALVMIKQNGTYAKILAANNFVLSQ